MTTPWVSVLRLISPPYRVRPGPDNAPRWGHNRAVERESGAAIEPAVVVGLLAEPGRVRVFAAVLLGASTLAEVASVTGLALPVVSRALDRLMAGGLVEEVPAGYRVREERLQAAARQAARQVARDRPRGVDDGSLSGAQREVLGHFLVDGRLSAIPVARNKRLVVLDYLAARFEPGKVYPERDVNFVLGQVHADYAALRRYLVDEGLLERRDGFYWRVGGTFDVDGA